MFEHSFRGPVARRVTAAELDRRRLRSKLVIFRGVIRDLPPGSRVSILPCYRKMLARRRTPIPSWRLTIVRPCRFTLTTYPTTEAGPGRNISFQIQSESDSVLPTAIVVLQNKFFRDVPFTSAQLSFSVTNVQRLTLLLPSAEFNLNAMRDPRVPRGMGVSLRVEERNEGTCMRYRILSDLSSDTTGLESKCVATNFTRDRFISMGCRGYDVSAKVTYAVACIVCETPGMITLFCDENGKYTRGVRGPCPLVWEPGVAGLEKLALADVFDEQTLAFEPTPAALHYLEQMRAGRTIPALTRRKKQ